MKATSYMEAKAKAEQIVDLKAELYLKQIKLVAETEGAFHSDRHDEYMRKYDFYAFWQMMRDFCFENTVKLEERAAWIGLDEHKRSRNGNSHHPSQNLQDFVRRSGPPGFPHHLTN